MNKNITRTIILLAGVTLIVTQSGSSCISDTSSNGGTNYPTGDRDPPRDEDANYIPQRADIVREGRGTLQYKADADGTVYVQNLRHEQTVLARRVHRGQVIEVMPVENRIRLDDDTISKSDLKVDDTHRIYLLRDRRFEDDRDRNDRDDGEKDETSRPPRGVPGEAQLMGEGKNKEISFSPSKTGGVYVYNVDDRKLTARIPIRAGQRFVLSPGKARATIDGKTAQQSIFDTKTTYRVFFNREG